MSILTDRIAVRLAAFYNEHYPGQDYERSEFLGEADVVVAVVREVLLSDQAIEAGKDSVHGGKGCTCRTGARGDAEAVIRAALDAVTGEQEL